MTPRNSLIQFAGNSLGTAVNKEIDRYQSSVVIEEVVQDHKDNIGGYFNHAADNDIAWERLLSAVMRKASRVRAAILSLNCARDKMKHKGG